MQEWEHYVWYLDTSGEAESILADLTTQARDGWELVAVAPHTSSVSGDRLVAFFKRPKKESPSEPLVRHA